MARRESTRAVRPTTLIVGEGYAEAALLRHLRALYTSNQQGCRLEIGNARGKGAAHVVDYSIRFAARAQYDQAAALFDADTDWSDAVAARARKAGLIVLCSTPCVEAWLLDIVGQARAGGSADQKARFQQHFGGEAHEEKVFATHLPRSILDAARRRVALLDRLLALLETKTK